MRESTWLKVRRINKNIALLNCLKLLETRYDVEIGSSCANSKILLFLSFHICHKMSVTRVSSKGPSLSNWNLFYKVFHYNIKLVKTHRVHFITTEIDEPNCLDMWILKENMFQGFRLRSTNGTHKVMQYYKFYQINKDQQSITKKSPDENFQFRRDLDRPYTPPSVRIDTRRRGELRHKFSD